MVSVDTARKYFDEHLLGTFFLESGSQLTAAAIRMAEKDIRTQLDVLPEESDADYVAAVCEQAVFLLMHKDELIPEAKRIASESIEGLGSRTYADSAVIFAPRAEIFMESIRRRYASAINIKRG